MKFQSLNKRVHNIIFHTHTVSGIVISFLLYIIFFAGAFALFTHEGARWENPYARYVPENIDIEKSVNTVFDEYPTIDKYDGISISLPTDCNPQFKMYVDALQPDSTSERREFYINTKTNEVKSEDQLVSHVFDTLYRLHFFGQIPFGRYLSGLVGLFLVFATITGLLVHWKDMVDKFYLFRTKGGLKNLWKDAHTALGFIGLPFQLIYGITGAFFGLSILILAPSVLLLFDGDSTKVRGVVDPFFIIEVNREAAITKDNISIDDAYAIVKQKYPHHDIDFIRIKNYDTDAEVASFIFDEETLFGNGLLLIEMKSGKIIGESIPNQHGIKGALGLMSKLHFASFGGLWMKFVYFVLSIITCFIILSGVLLWQSARDNKKYTDRQRRFHHRVTKCYLSICLSLFPAVAILFLTNMLVPFEMKHRVDIVDIVFFASWGVLCFVGYFWDEYSKMVKYHLLLGAVFGLCVPVANGIMTGDWIWDTLSSGKYYIAGVDLFWLIVGLLIGSVYLSRGKNQFHITK